MVRPAGPSAFRADERGSGSVWLLMMCMVLAVVAVASVLVGAAIVARHRAGAAADLAALAAARRHLDPGPAQPCDAAADIAEAMGGELIRCELSADRVDVTVAFEVHIGRLGTGRVEADARAGPADPAGGRASGRPGR